MTEMPARAHSENGRQVRPFFFSRINGRGSLQRPFSNRMFFEQGSTPMTKQDAITKAQIIANRRGQTLAVLKLNPFDLGSCVMREWDQR
jgi:hypothetical protein